MPEVVANDTDGRMALSGSTFGPIAVEDAFNGADWRSTAEMVGVACPSAAV